MHEKLHDLFEPEAEAALDTINEELAATIARAGSVVEAAVTEVESAASEN